MVIFLKHFSVSLLISSQTLEGHSTPITCLDFSEPYGTLVSASRDDPQLRVWDLFSGVEVGRLRGHRGTVKCVQVEDTTCLTGSEDGSVRIWDLRQVEDRRSQDDDVVSLNDIQEDEEILPTTAPEHTRHSDSDSACTKTLDGHTKAVTALYFEDDCLVWTSNLTSLPSL